ncbi:efflux transporter periplasmic adaptor subunit, partial [Bacillus thuringiensis]
MILDKVHLKRKKQKRFIIIIGSLLLISIVVFINIYMMHGKKKSITNTDAVSFEKVTERKLNNTKLVSGQVKPGNIESFYGDSAKGKVKDIEVK